MTHATQPARALDGLSVWRRLAALRADWAQRAAQRRVYRATLAELEGLSDRDLADMGIHRSRLPEIAAEAARAA